VPLFVTRIYGEGVKIGDNVWIMVMPDPNNARRIRLAITAPKDLPVRFIDRRSAREDAQVVAKDT
jgi:sRNA-binding carbon storage regulator CsrA